VPASGTIESVTAPITKRRFASRGLRWILLSLTVVLVLALAASFWTPYVGLPHTYIALDGASVVVWYDPSIDRDRRVAGWTGRTSPFQWRPRFGHSRAGWYFILPLWIPLAASGLLTGASWWRWWTAVAPGGCIACGYDLKGLAPNTPCPECGHTLGAKP
jgi:hypothetical protein